MKKLFCLLGAVLCLAGCSPAQAPEALPSPTPAEIAADFAPDQLYGVAFLGWQDQTALESYRDLADPDTLPVYHISAGECYLILPRYADMALRLYADDPVAGTRTLVVEDPACGPFVLECNVSDLYPDAVVELSREGQSVSFSPWHSLKDGTLQLGEEGLDLTR